jgi:hypothetical protein
MRVLCFSGECKFLLQLLTAFSDVIESIDCQGKMEGFLDLADEGSWDAFLIDFDAIPLDHPNLLEFVNRLGPYSSVFLIGSAKSEDLHDQLESEGVILLHKPTTIGEIGLALRKVAARKNLNISRETA